MSENRLIKNRIWMVCLIVIVAGISAVLLTAINIYTKERIALNREIKLKRSVLDVFDIPYGEKKEVVAIFDKLIDVQKIDGKTFYRHRDKGKLLGVAFEVKGPGFWGPISALVALTPELDSIKGIEILHQEETPGLGGRITEEEFKNQFKGKPVEPKIRVEAITGATMTSKAFKKIINEGVREFRERFKRREAKTW